MTFRQQSTCLQKSFDWQAKSCFSIVFMWLQSFKSFHKTIPQMDGQKYKKL